MKKMWLRGAEDSPDLYAAFRGSFCSDTERELPFAVSGCSWYRVFVNGTELTEGPDRYDDAHPVYKEVSCRVRQGENIIFAVVHSVGIPTRILKNTAPFFACESPGLSIEWSCTRLDAYARKVRRINPELGWMECRTIKELPPDAAWERPDFLEKDPYGAFCRDSAKAVSQVELAAVPIGRGFLMQRFGYEYDDIPAAFYLRSLEPPDRTDRQGVWFRFDLRKICLFRFEAEITAPAGTVFEIGYAEALTDGRVAPYITLSAGPSCNLDRYILKEGRQTFGNLTPRGGRYAEIHILGDPEAVTLHSCRFWQRTYFPLITGSFSCGDKQLDKIWKTGAVTLQSCAEDAITDNPTRERGEWTGDAVSAPMDLIAAAFGDFSLIRRALKHSADCAGPDGCVAGLSPGGGLCVSSYALQWVSACKRYFTYTGDDAFYREAYPAALKNMAYFREHYTSGIGLDREIHWLFIDWGYVTNDGPGDLAALLLLCGALDAMSEWSRWMSDPEREKDFTVWREDAAGVIRRYLSELQYDFGRIGLHRTALSYGAGLIPPEHRQAALQSIKEHYLNCFPNRKDAPRLSSPSENCPQLITPYFSHFVFPLLFESGEGAFVIEQHKKCWGWMLTQEDGTWLEVFDPRWSHCHEWSGCPTWQLSVYVLGLRRRFDIETNCFAYSAADTGIRDAEGAIPAEGGTVRLRLREGKFLSISSDVDITVIHGARRIRIPAGGERILLPESLEEVSNETI